MKRIALLLLIFGTAAAVCAQTNPNVLRRLDFTPEEVERMEEVQESAIAVIKPAQAEINVIRQKLTRLLLRDDVNLEEIEGLLRQSMEWEFKVRMAEITQQVAIRRIVGDQRWAVMLRAAQILRDPENARRIENAQLGDNLNSNPSLRARVLNILRNLTRG